MKLLEISNFYTNLRIGTNKSMGLNSFRVSACKPRQIKDMERQQTVGYVHW
jgi:hypothetical protein